MTRGFYDNLILKREAFYRETIEKRMAEGGFNSIARFELFLWDIEIFLHLQKFLGDRIALKGGAAVQFYIPIENQRTSVDIDILCSASEDETAAALRSVEQTFANDDGLFRFRKHTPANPSLPLSSLSTYFMRVPTVCSANDLRGTGGGRQEVKIEFLYAREPAPVNIIASPDLFALDTSEEFNVLPLECLFADKLTTLGPNTIGIPKRRSDEQFKQIYDIITLFMTNKDFIFKKSDAIREYYYKNARNECELHGIEYDEPALLCDMLSFLARVQNIENDSAMLQSASDFQALYLKNSVRRKKSDWAVAGFQLELLVRKIFHGDCQIDRIADIDYLIARMKYSDIRGPERGAKIQETKAAIQKLCAGVHGLSIGLFNKAPERVIWELVKSVGFDALEETLHF